MGPIWGRELSAERIAYLAQSRIPEIIACNVVLLTFATGGLLIRLFVRVRYLTGINLDDMVFTFILCFTAMLMTKYGFGKHIGTVANFSDRAMFLKLDFVTMLAYVLALGTIKMSFCLLYLHIFPGQKFRIACWWLLAIVVAQTIAETLVVLFQCTPVHKAWDATGLVEGTCVDMNAFYYANFAVKLASDFALFLMPIPKVIRLRMSVGSMVNAMNWSCVEVALAIFIACIPSFNTLIIFRFPRLQRLLGLPSNKSDRQSKSKTYGSSSRRMYNNMSDDGNDGLKLEPITGHSHADVEPSFNCSQEHIIHAGMQETTNVKVNDKSV
ncbi:hypothetical protein N7451_006746 [Penicillium sp. IBT 35674x]|nr:hypothetical protein N7451_006746 [Penicillium sp. IBT 35674x]